MSSNPSRAKSERIRHRIKAIELQPMRSKYPISMKLWVDDKVVCELPEIKKGRDLIWSRPIVCRDASPQAKVTLEIREIHTMMDRCFKSQTYEISEMQDRAETTIGFAGTEWTAKLTMLTPETVEQSRADALQQMKETELAPRVLERLGEAQRVIETVLDFGNAVADTHPAAKLVFSICTVAWEKLKEEEQLKEDTQELLDGLTEVAELAETVKKNTNMKQLKQTIEDILMLLEDVFIYVLEHESQDGGGAIQVLRRVFDSSGHDTVQELLDRFKKLRRNFNSGVRVDTHAKAHEQELQRQLDMLQPVSSAGYNLDRACQDGTREHVIASIMNWTERHSATSGSDRLLWIHGQAGIGKSSIASSVCGRLKDANALAASFFCKSDGGPDLHDPLRLVNTIAYSLANRCPEYAEAVVAAMKGDRELCMTNTLKDRYEGLIEKPLESLRQLAVPRPLIVLIDALDEFGKTTTSRDSIVERLWKMSQLVPWLKVVITSRPDADIKGRFGESGDLLVSPLNVHDFDASDDIRAYLQKELGRLATRPGWKWPEDTVDRLTKKAGGLFIWASTVKLHIEGPLGFRDAMGRLNAVLSGHHGLDKLYERVLETGMKDPGDDNRVRFCQCIGVIVVASTRQPLSIADLSSLLDEQIEGETLKAVVDRLGAVIHVDQQMGNALRFYHQSFVDYILGQSPSNGFYVNPGERNAELAAGCLKTMKQLKFNICGLETSHLSNSQVPDLDARIRSSINGQLRYSCMYWINHLTDTFKAELKSEVEDLLNERRVLYWLEVLSLLGQLEMGLTGLLELLNGIRSEWCKLRECISDLYSFTSAFYDAISASTPHLYVSALALAPESSGVVRRLGKYFPRTVVVASGGDRSWPRWLRTFTQPNTVYSAAISTDGRRFVTCCADNMIHLWDMKTGVQVGEPLIGRSELTSCIALSPNGDLIVSDSNKNYIQFWDVKARAAIGEPLVGHSGWVVSIAFSPNGDLVVTGSYDKTLRIWDVKTRTAIGEPLVGHSEGVGCVSFSPNSDLIASGSVDKTIQMWDVRTRAPIGEPLVGHSELVKSVAFSPNGDLIASGSADKTLRMWNAKTRSPIGNPLVGHSDMVTCIAFSPNGEFVLSGSDDNTVRVWDTKTLAAIGGPLVGHSGRVSSVFYAPISNSIVSSSWDATVRTWDAKTMAHTVADDLLDGHSCPVTSVAFSPNGDVIISGSEDKTVRMWDARTYAAVGKPLVGHSDAVNSVACSPNGDLIISGSDDQTLRIWDAQACASIGEPLVGHSEFVSSVAFSPTGELIASGSWDKTVRIWDVKAHAAVDELVGHTDRVTSVAFSSNGDFIVSGSWDYTVRMWDAKTHAAIGQPLIGHSDSVTCVAISSNGSLIVSGSDDKTLRMWDAKTHAPIGEPLIGHSHLVKSVAFSHSGNFIASGSYDCAVRMWDAKTQAPVGKPLEGHSDIVMSISFSPDDDLVVSGSHNGTVHVRNIKAGASLCESSHPHCNFLQPQAPVASGIPQSLRLLTTFELPRRSWNDGWVSFDNESLILWLPIRYRRPYDPRVLYSITAHPDRATILLDVSKFVHGASWTSIFSEPAHRDDV